MIEAVVVSVDFGDYLRTTLPYTLAAVDDVVVVTSHEDKVTQRVCAELDVRCIKSHLHKDHSHTRSKFDKARLINQGLAHLGCDDWLLQLDSDVVIPRAFKHWTREAKLDKTCIYGVDRYDCVGVDNWEKVLKSKWLDHHRQWGYLIQPPPHCKPATRVGHGDHDGWIAIGFSQLFHSSQQTRYPTKPTANAEHSDLLFCSYWPREKRILAPDYYAIHLSSGGRSGDDWGGRTSPPWCPPKPYC